MRYKKSRKSSFVKDVVGTGVGNIVGIGMIGATAEMANALPAGTAKTITGVIPGLQSVALVGHNLKPFSKKKKSIW